MAGNSAEDDKSKKIKLGFAILALVLGGAGIAYSMGLFDSVLTPKVTPGAAETGINAPLATTPQLTEQEKIEAEQADAELKETIKDKPASGS